MVNKRKLHRAIDEVRGQEDDGMNDIMNDGNLSNDFLPKFIREGVTVVNKDNAEEKVKSMVEEQKKVRVGRGVT